MMKSSEVRLIILRKFKEMWEMNPDKRAYIETQSVWTPIVEKIGDRITGEFATTVFASLTQDGYLESIDLPNPEGELIMHSRITDKGLEYLSEFEKAMITRRIAMLGAVTGCAGLIVAIISLFL